MRKKLITAVAAAALLTGGTIAFAQGGEGGANGGAGTTHEGGGKGGEKTSQGGGEKAGGERGRAAERTGGGEKAGAREERKADQGEKGADRGDRAERGERGDRDHADRDRGEHGDGADRGERDHDRADRGDRGRDQAERENVHVSIRVGGAVPEGRRLAPLKTTLVERYPQYRGFEMFTENDEIIIVDPGTRKIARTVSESEAGMNPPPRPTAADGSLCMTRSA